MRVPVLQPRDVDAGVRVGHRREEVVRRHRLAVVPLKVQVHALPEAALPEQGVVHANHLGAFFVHGERVEVVDLHVRRRAHRVRHRRRVLGELRVAQETRVGDAFHRSAGNVRAELLVAEHGQAFFEAKLDEKYPFIAREALNKMYTKSQMLGADAFFSMGLNERYPNSIKSFTQIADLKTIFKYKILEKYPELGLEEFVTKRLNRAQFHELINQGIPDKMPEFYADRLVEHIEDHIKDSQYDKRFDIDVRSNYISDAIDAIKKHKPVISLL